MASRTAAARIRKGNRGGYHIIHIHEQREAPPRELQRCSSTPWHVVFIFVIPVEVGVLQVHFPNSSPFETHPANMWTFVFAIFIYCIALAYYVKYWLTGSKCFKNICDKVGYISGLLVSAAFISVLVPPSFESFVFVIWILISSMFIDVARDWIILNVVQNVFNFAQNTVSFVHDIWKLIIGSDDNVGATTIPL